MIKVFSKKPRNFQSNVEVSTVFMECENKLLLLQRASQKKISPEKWAVPGGKLENQETPLEGLMREVSEEVHLFPTSDELKYIHTLYVRHPLLNYKLHLFRWFFDSIPAIVINPEEHQNFIWQPINMFEQVPLLEVQPEAFRFIYARQLQLPLSFDKSIG